MWLQTAAIRDPRYKKDRAYEQDVQARIAVTDFEAVTGASINGSIKPGSDAPADYQEGNEVFHSKAEAMLLMKSHEYKTDPYFREMVARALDNSVHGSIDHHGDGTVQFRGEISGPDKPGSESDPSDNDDNSSGRLTVGR